MTLLALRHNLTQRLLAALLSVSQSAVCRAIGWMRGVLVAVLAPEITRAGDAERALAALLDEAGADDAGAPRSVVVLVDGTLVPVADRRRDVLNYSGKHRRMGRSLQVVADTRGRLLCVGPPQPGRLHDNLALRSSGQADVLRSDERLLVHRDLGYRGLGFLIPHRAPVHGHLSPLQRAENHDLCAIRNAVERSIAAIKTLAVLRTGIRTRAPERERVIGDHLGLHRPHLPPPGGRHPCPLTHQALIHGGHPWPE